MSRKLTLPKIDARQAPDLLRQLRRMAPHYTREWLAKDDDDPGVALLKVFSFIGEGVISRLNRAPERNFLAFLDMLGIRLLPATPARAPVRFVLAKGVTDAFLVEKGAQVSAPPTGQRPVELPFETIDSLWVIPAALTELISVDPSKDNIYKPPPGFLGLELAATDLPPLTVTAFSAAGSKFLQLDPPDQVKKDDFLRIDHAVEAGSRLTTDCPPPSDSSGKQLGAVDHLVVLDTKGTIVTVADPLPRDYLENTLVRKVTDFELFEAKNWQEHVLYLGHAEYFAIKSAAQIELLVEHAGAVANLDSLDVIWEFFGIDETDPDKEEKWHRFEVELDGTVGFSRSGRVVLNKPAGEIKEKEINGNKSRWIRARLDESLPATPIRPLPKIESLTFAVASGGEDLAVDQAFHNDTPLTTDVEFFPFGTEPRIFDRFSIASEEAFSKPGAEIDLEFSMDTSDLLAAPVAILKQDAGEDNRIRVFARAAAGRLLEFQINPETSEFLTNKHLTPPDTRITAESIPAVLESGSTVGVFVKADDGKIYLRHIVGEDKNNWKWLSLLAPPGQIQFNPAAVRVGSFWFVFVVSDSQLFSKALNPNAPYGAGLWTPQPSAFQVASTPFPFLFGPNASWAIAVADAAGNTWLFDGATWKDITPKEANLAVLEPYLAAKDARPFAQPYMNGTQVRIFLRTRRSGVVVFDTEVNANANAKILGKPPGVEVASDPFVADIGGSTIVLVRGSDNRLWQIDYTNGGDWAFHSNPADFNLASDPFAVCYKAGPDNKWDLASVFSTTDKNSLLEFRVSGADAHTGKLRAGPLDIVMLRNNLGAGNYIIQITDGPSAGAVRRINSTLSSGKFAVLTEPLEAIADDETEYNLFEEKHLGFIASVTSDDDSTLIELEATAQPDADDWLIAADQLRKIDDITDGKAEFEPPWETVPDAGAPYVLLRMEAEDKTVTDGSGSRALLASNASSDDEEYEDLFLEITSGPGNGPIGRRIVKYFGNTKNVVLKGDFGEPPTSESTYKITVSTVAEALSIYKDADEIELRPELSWEYWNGRGWVALWIDEDTTENFLVPGKIKFTLPEDVAKTEVAGQENFWIRARIVGGDYGREQFKFDDVNKTVTIEKDPIRPPLVNKLAVKYKVVELKPPQICLTFNNLNYLDQTAANVTPDKHFSPYLSLEDAGKTIYFGFDREFEGGPVRLYFAAMELESDERNKPKLTWEFKSDNTWKSLIVDDGTDAFTKPDFVTLILPDGFQNTQEFGRTLYWLRATLSKGEWSKSPLFKGVFPNTVATLQARTIRNEILGSSTGIKNQKFQFRQVPVIENEEVRVLEVLTDAEKEQLLLERGDDAVRAITDQRGAVLQTWVRWTEVIEFFDSTSESRHYRLDRATGEIEFGDGVRGRIPPAGGDNIQAFAYQTGGGASGNVLPGEIKTAVTAVAGVDSVINPVAAGGGSEAATNDDMLVIGPAQISHRDRAVTPEDFERLAQEASREVRKALCRPNRNAGGRHELGWTSVHIVPDSKDARPMPSLELRRSVQRFLSKRADVTLVDQDHIFVAPPKYVPVSVEVTIFAKSIDVVAKAEKNVREKLEQFLHPLTGGPTGEGWEFGRDLAASDLYALLEDIDEVDHVGSLRLLFGDAESEERVVVDPDALLASGTHKVDMSVALEKR